MVQKIITNNNVVIFDKNDTTPERPSVQAFEHRTILNNVWGGGRTYYLVDLAFILNDNPEILKFFQKKDKQRVVAMQLVVNEDGPNQTYYWSSNVQHFSFNGKEIVGLNIMTDVNKTEWASNYQNKCRITKLIYEII